MTCHKTKPSERIPLHIVRIVSQYFALVAVVLHLRKSKKEMFKDTTIGAVIARLRSMVTIIIIERERKGGENHIKDAVGSASSGMHVHL